MQNIVTNLQRIDGEWRVEVTPGVKGSATGTLLTDSDQQSFVYLFDEGERFVPIHFPQDVWSALKEAYETREPLYVETEVGAVKLERFYDELDALLLNIEGNGNYGSFTTAVEQMFAARIEALLDER